MSRTIRRLEDQVADLSEQLQLIRDALDVVDEQRLTTAITEGPEGGQLHQVLANLRTLAGPRRNP